MSQTLVEEFKQFYSKFPISLRTGDNVNFFASRHEVEMIYNFEVHKLVVIDEVTKRLKGVSFELTFTEEGRNILLFEKL